MRKKKSFALELEQLLDQLCRDWGFCLPAEKREAIAKCKQLREREFAARVLQAEGLLEHEGEWLKRLADRFRQHSEDRSFVRKNLFSRELPLADC